MNIKERLIHFAQSQNIPISRLERLSGLSNGYIKNTNGNPTVPKLEGVLRAFPNLSREWLINGTGPMLLSEPASSNTEQREADDIIYTTLDGHQLTARDIESMQQEIVSQKDELYRMYIERDWFEYRITTLLTTIENLTKK